jgi:hypothetical protein
VMHRPQFLVETLGIFVECRGAVIPNETP